MVARSVSDPAYGMVDLGGKSDLAAASTLEIGDRPVSERRLPMPPKPPPAPKTLVTARASVASAPGSGRASVAKVGSRSPLQSSRVEDPRSAALPLDLDTAYDGGKTLDENPFGSLGGDAPLPALELDLPDVVKQGPLPQSAPALMPGPPMPSARPPAQAAEEEERGPYGAVPRKLYAAPLYCVRVMLRKRELEAELREFSAQRKRADDAAQETLIKLGEALFEHRIDPALAALDKLFAAVSNADSQVGQLAAQDSKRKQDTENELSKLNVDAASAEARMLPLREGEAQLLAKIEEANAQVKRAEMRVQNAQNALDAAKRANPSADFSVLRAERDVKRSEAQALSVQIKPIEDDLKVARHGIAQQLRAIAGIQADKQGAATALQRAQQTHRVSVGSARGARAQALRALARAAITQGLGGASVGAMGAVAEATQRAEQRRQLEEEQRAAVASYDHKVYGRGLSILLGGSALMFLGFVLKILF